MSSFGGFSNLEIEELNRKAEITRQQLEAAERRLKSGVKTIKPGHLLGEDYKRAEELGISVFDLVPDGEVRRRPLGRSQEKYLLTDIGNRIG